MLYALLITTYSSVKSHPRAVADAFPWFNWTVSKTSTLFIALITASLKKGTGSPFSKTQTSLMLIATLFSSTVALLLPKAASILPQLGSLPWIAVFTRLDPAMVLAAERASDKDAAPATFTFMSFCAPSEVFINSSPR